jgi:hypothetical protein
VGEDGANLATCSIHTKSHPKKCDDSSALLKKEKRKKKKRKYMIKRERGKKHFPLLDFCYH